jgi:hypothetical protein
MRRGEDRLRGRVFLQLSKLGISFFALHPAYHNFPQLLLTYLLKWGMFVCFYIIGVFKIIRDSNSQWLATTFLILSAFMVITINAFLIMLVISGRNRGLPLS